MGTPNIFYNARSNRWEVRGKGGTLLNTIPDNSQPMARVQRFVGSTAAIAAGIASISLATLSNTANVNRGDFVFVTAKTRNLAGGVIAVSVPSNSLVELSVFGSLPAMGWDVFAIRPG